MNVRVLITVILATAVAACATTPATRTANKEIFKPPGLSKTTSPTEAVRVNARMISAEEQSVTQAALWPFCDCENEKDKDGKSRKDYREALQEKTKEQVATQSRLDGLNESFAEVNLAWVKKSLETLNHYDADEVNGRRNAIIASGDYNKETIDAAKKFQCGYYPLAIDGECDQTRATGWLTFTEARAAVCNAGYLGTDETSVELAKWYTDNRVFERNTAYANWILNKLQNNLADQVARDPENSEIYLEMANRARAQETEVERVILSLATDDNGRISSATLTELRGDNAANLTVDEICPR